MDTTRRPEQLWRALLGSVLRDRRRALGRTLAQVAARAGVSVQYLSEVERGLKDPSSEIIAAISGALELTLIDLTRSVGDLALTDRTYADRARTNVLELRSRRSVHAVRQRSTTPTVDTSTRFTLAA